MSGWHQRSLRISGYWRLICTHSETLKNSISKMRTPGRETSSYKHALNVPRYELGKITLAQSSYDNSKNLRPRKSSRARRVYVKPTQNIDQVMFFSTYQVQKLPLIGYTAVDVGPDECIKGLGGRAIPGSNVQIPGWEVIFKEWSLIAPVLGRK
ncbi:hypothetical protein K505DRAFT_320602 [Melanomma pulvis-pyrius CBS 109.77]|uniref:Uncharacterized protein n=1 Tax=Melanomma pulvis-pyrius CBS 109.77 TaxID=1314802 RepID=A0A6A6XVM3_9PLEO|nr:hypothetical protein K505DRAFT_320602 [Melanomma pulvis-pyrius CBS 109.77]